MVIPYLKIAGGVALLWIATKLLVQDSNGSEPETSASRNLLDAVKAIAVADVVVSLDNVIAVVAAADGNFALIVFGLGMSIPVIIAGATIIMVLLNRFPAIAWAGAAMLGWIAGDVIATDAAGEWNTPRRSARPCTSTSGLRAIAEFAVGLAMIAQRRAAGLDRRIEHRLDGVHERNCARIRRAAASSTARRVHKGLRTRVGGAALQWSRRGAAATGPPVQGFADIDVAEAGDDGLVLEQRRQARLWSAQAVASRVASKALPSGSADFAHQRMGRQFRPRHQQHEAEPSRVVERHGRARRHVEHDVVTRRGR